MRWWLWWLATMLAALCQWLLFRNRLEMVVMLLAVAVALLVSIPALVSILWREDIERILADRSVDLPAVQALERHSVRSFNKMLLWLVAFVLILAWLSRGNWPVSALAGCHGRAVCGHAMLVVRCACGSYTSRLLAILD